MRSQRIGFTDRAAVTGGFGNIDSGFLGGGCAGSHTERIDIIFDPAGRTLFQIGRAARQDAVFFAVVKTRIIKNFGIGFTGHQQGRRFVAAQ